jgi:hypothetical protein
MLTVIGLRRLHAYSDDYPSLLLVATNRPPHCEGSRVVGVIAVATHRRECPASGVYDASAAEEFPERRDGATPANVVVSAH